MAATKNKWREPVQAREELVTIPTYEPAPPDKNPMFLEKRVYQGSTGKVYPLPFTDRISTDKTARQWRAVWLENQYLRVMVLPEIGGRIHIAQDKTNGYDFVYRQTVIKPALVGLAGPWVSGGIEFNWPQHHRPGTFMPVDYHIEEHADGSKTLWCSDHDPMCRMKGMHGICLHPDKAYIELKVRAYNRTPLPQTFLWWANVATRVHEGYQSFFPPDVYYVADHARRSMSEYPVCQGYYYGVNYGERGRKGAPGEEIPANFIPPHCLSKSQVASLKSRIPVYAPNDLSWYSNIPVPTSYMCMGSQEDFFGGYDHFQQAGLVHIANHHISPGKKQWTWGNHEFGYAWDRNLTDSDGPYIELMAGVYTDNQPDFSFLQPGETKTWSQYWYPIQKIGPAQHANLSAAVSLQIDRQRVRIGVSVSAAYPKTTIRLEHEGTALEWDRDLAPGKPFVVDFKQTKRKWPATGVTLRVLDRAGREIIAFTPKPRIKAEVPPPATEPPAPPAIASTDELFVTGLHLEQYRHATRCPTQYWREALRRDPGDARCNNAMGLWHLRRGEFAIAENHLRKAIERLTRRNPNPSDGAAYYHLGLCLRYQLDAPAEPCSSRRKEAPILRKSEPPDVGCYENETAAYAAFYKATWNQAWAAAGYHSLAEMDCRRADWTAALDHLDRSLRYDTDNLRARNLKVIVLRKLERNEEARRWLNATLALDPLDWWARWLRSRDRLPPSPGLRRTGKAELQTCLDIAHDCARAGLYVEAAECLRGNSANLAARDPRNLGAEPLIHYTLGWLYERMGDAKRAAAARKTAAASAPDYCFPARLEEIAILGAAMRANPKDARAPYYLGNLLYDRRRQREAIAQWEHSARLDPSFSVVWRNLGIGYFNELKQPARARAAYEKAFAANPSDTRLLYERDQLWKRMRVPPQKRLRELEKHLDLVRQRDDLCVELCALYNQTGQHLQAMQLLNQRHFQPWEGGEGQALGQHVRTQLALGREAKRHHFFPCAVAHFRAALTTPPNLGEAKHLLANQSDIHFWLGEALQAVGQRAEARRHWQAAANFKGDFQAMSVRAFSEMTYYSALACERLGRKTPASRLLKELLAFAGQLETKPAQIDYFATSLPTMLLFEDDLQFRQQTTALFMQAQARLGLGERAKARALLRTVLKRDPNHALAFDLSENL